MDEHSARSSRRGFLLILLGVLTAVSAYMFAIFESALPPAYYPGAIEFGIVVAIVGGVAGLVMVIVGVVLALQRTRD